MADYFESGFCVRERSWHGKELLIAEAPASWDEGRRLAGLQWEPQAEPVYRRTTITAGGDAEYEQVPGQVITRSDTGAALGLVSDTFQLITHAEMGDIMETVLGEANVRLDTMGSVRGGRQVYATVLLDEPYQINGDVDGFGDPVLTLPYFALLNSHDGSGACKGLYTQVRVVCANTVQAASIDGDRHGAQFTLRHTSGVKARLDEVKQVVAGARVEALRWKALAEELALIEVNPIVVSRFLSEFIPEPVAGLVSDRVMGNVAAERAKFLHLLNNSATNCAMAGTALGVVNAAVEYLDHARGYRNQATYMGRQMLQAEPLKAKAVRMVRTLATAGV